MGRLWEWDFDLSMIFHVGSETSKSFPCLKRSALALWILPGRGRDHPRYGELMVSSTYKPRERRSPVFFLTCTPFSFCYRKCWGRCKLRISSISSTWKRRKVDERVVVLVDIVVGFSMGGLSLHFVWYCHITNFDLFPLSEQRPKIPWSFSVWDLKWCESTRNDFHILVKVLGTLMRICIIVRQELCKLCVFTHSW